MLTLSNPKLHFALYLILLASNVDGVTGPKLKPPRAHGNQRNFYISLRWPLNFIIAYEMTFKSKSKVRSFSVVLVLATKIIIKSFYSETYKYSLQPAGLTQAIP